MPLPGTTGSEDHRVWARDLGTSRSVSCWHKWEPSCWLV